MTRFISVCVLKPSILNDWFSHAKLNIFSQLCPMINIAVIKNSAAHNIKSHIVINLSLDLMGKCHCYSRLNREVIIKAWLLFIIYSYCLIKATVKSHHSLWWSCIIWQSSLWSDVFSVGFFYKTYCYPKNQVPVDWVLLHRRKS